MYIGLDMICNDGHKFLNFLSAFYTKLSSLCGYMTFFMSYELSPSEAGSVHNKATRH